MCGGLRVRGANKMDALANVFGFSNVFVAAAFMVAALLVAFKFQWQGLFYMMVVIHAVNNWNAFVMVNLWLVVSLMLSAWYNTAAKSRSG